jgi:hypothetical protein
MTLKRDSARVPGAAQREALRCRTGTFTNACACDGPASAAQRFALHRVRDTERQFQVLVPLNVSGLFVLNVGLGQAYANGTKGRQLDSGQVAPTIF